MIFFLKLNQGLRNRYPLNEEELKRLQMQQAPKYQYRYKLFFRFCLKFSNIKQNSLTEHANLFN